MRPHGLLIISMIDIHFSEGDDEPTFSYGSLSLPHPLGSELNSRLIKQSGNKQWVLIVSTIDGQVPSP